MRLLVSQQYTEFLYRDWSLPIHLFAACTALVCTTVTFSLPMTRLWQLTRLTTILTATWHATQWVLICIGRAFSVNQFRCKICQKNLGIGLPDLLSFSSAWGRKLPGYPSSTEIWFLTSMAWIPLEQILWLSIPVAWHSNYTQPCLKRGWRIPLCEAYHPDIAVEQLRKHETLAQATLC